MRLRDFFSPESFSSHHIALAESTGSTSLTYAELWEMKACYQTQLAALSGKRVVIYMNPGVLFFPLLFALMENGCLCSLADPKESSTRLSLILEVSQSTAVLSDRERPSGFGNVEWQIITGPSPSRPSSQEDFSLTKDSIVLYTSGSEGKPKGVIYTNENWVFSTQNLIRNYGIHAETVELAIPSLFHSDGWQRAMAVLRTGGTVVLPGNASTVAHFTQGLSRTDINSFFLPFPLIELLRRSSPATIERLQKQLTSVELGSTFVPKEKILGLMEIFPQTDFFYHYGLTECSRAFILNCRLSQEKLGSVGKLSLGYSVETLSDGTLAIDSESRPLSYLQNGNKIATGEGAFRTKDIGKLDEDGYLFLEGRIDRILSYGTNKFYPREVSELLYRHPFVKDVEIGSGEEPTIFVVTSDKKDPQWQLPEFLKNKIKVVPEIERNASGKSRLT